MVYKVTATDSRDDDDNNISSSNMMKYYEKLLPEIFLIMKRARTNVCMYLRVNSHREAMINK